MFACQRGALLAELFDSAAVMADARSGREARGGEAIGRALSGVWAVGGTYVARPRRVLQARDTALVVGDAGIHVVRRGSDGTWRAAISLLQLDTPTTNRRIP